MKRVIGGVNAPRDQENADKSGSYEQAFRV